MEISNADDVGSPSVTASEPVEEKQDEQRGEFQEPIPVVSEAQEADVVEEEPMVAQEVVQEEQKVPDTPDVDIPGPALGDGMEEVKEVPVAEVVAEVPMDTSEKVEEEKKETEESKEEENEELDYEASEKKEAPKGEEGKAAVVSSAKLLDAGEKKEHSLWIKGLPNSIKAADLKVGVRGIAGIPGVHPESGL